MSKEQQSRIIGIVLSALIALAAVFGYDLVVVQPLAEDVATVEMQMTEMRLLMEVE